MGCCTGREDVKGMGPHSKASYSKLDAHFAADSKVLIETDPENSASNRNSAEFLKKGKPAYLDFCKSEKLYSELIDSINDPCEVINPKVHIGWSTKPTTIGSLSLVYLCKVCRENPEEIMPFLYPVLPTLVENIKNGTEDVRDSSLMLLYYVLDYASEEIFIQLLELQIFTVLMRSIMCSQQELRHLTAGVCYKIYKDRPYAQKIFIEMKGGSQLVQQISWSSENDMVLKTLLDYLSELLQDKDDMVMKEYISKLNKDNAIDIIRDISNTDKSTETLEAMDYLITLLTEDNKD